MQEDLTLPCSKGCVAELSQGSTILPSWTKRSWEDYCYQLFDWDYTGDWWRCNNLWKFHWKLNWNDKNSLDDRSLSSVQTTGMDPVTRRHVWDVIEEAKKGRAIVLTTHSMEEADILSDRIGIMAKGRLRCIGTSIRLKSRFGTGFIANVSFSGDVDGTSNRDTVSTPQQIAVKHFFESHLDVLPKEENKSYVTFVIPHGKEKLLKNFFAELQDREKEFGISDIQLGLTTLEEVFLNIAKQSEIESAAAEGKFTTLTLDSGASLQVPTGVRFVGIPGTASTENPRGVMVEVYWEQDDSGALCISGHSEMFPIPPQCKPRK